MSMTGNQRPRMAPILSILAIVAAFVLVRPTDAGAQSICCYPFWMPSVYTFAGGTTEWDLTETSTPPLAPKRALASGPGGVAQAAANVNGASGFMAMASAHQADAYASPEARVAMDFTAIDPLGRDRVKVEVEILGIASGGPTPPGFPYNGGYFIVEIGEYDQVGLLRQDPGNLVMTRWLSMRRPPILMIDGSHRVTPVNKNRLRIYGNGIPIEDTSGSGPIVYNKKVVLNVAAGVVNMIDVHARAWINGFAYVDPVVRPHADNPEVTVTLRGAPDPAQPPLAIPSRDELVASGIDVAPLDELGLFDPPAACTNGTPITAAMLALRTDDAATRGRLRFGGKLALSPGDPPFDPIARGARVRIEDASGEEILDEIVLGGAYDPATSTGWRHLPELGRWIYTRPGSQGVHRIVVKRAPGSAEVHRFHVMARLGATTIPTAEQLPLTGSFVLDTPAAENGQCGEVEFGGPEPATPCAVHEATRLVCH